MSSSQVFNNYSRYLKNKYGQKAYRVGIDAGFSCPNRGADRNGDGCTYCDNYGARAPYLADAHTLAEQVRDSVRFLQRRYNAHIFLLYFQAYTSTWAPVSTLRELYDTALAMEEFKEFIVSTRPDCFGEDVADLLASYCMENREIWVELGLQSSSDKTLDRVNRGHNAKEFQEAVNRARQRGIKTVAHLIFGLPGEGLLDILKSVDFVVSQKVDAIKIHNLHIPQGAPLYREYKSGELAFPSMERHMDYCISALERIPEDMVIMRLTNDTPKQRQATPGDFWNKSLFYDRLRERMKELGTYQGKALQII